jgi:hypothetical protein
MLLCEGHEEGPDFNCLQRLVCSEVWKGASEGGKRRIARWGANSSGAALPAVGPNPKSRSSTLSNPDSFCSSVQGSERGASIGRPSGTSDPSAEASKDLYSSSLGLELARPSPKRLSFYKTFGRRAVTVSAENGLDSRRGYNSSTALV